MNRELLEALELEDELLRQLQAAKPALLQKLRAARDRLLRELQECNSQEAPIMPPQQQLQALVPLDPPQQVGARSCRLRRAH